MGRSSHGSVFPLLTALVFPLRRSPLAAITHVDYDGNGNVLTRRDAKDHVTTFTYDVLNRPLTRTYPTTAAGTATVIDTYDGNGNVLTHTDANGRVQEFTWDALNRRTTATYSGAGPADIATAVYTHDGNGNLTHETLTRGDGTSEALTRHYDPFDRLSDETNRDGQLLSYVYDLNGNRTQRSGDTGTVQYTPDALNRIVRVDDPAVGAVVTTYTKAGRLAQLDYADGTRSQWTYDPAGRLTTIEHRRAGATLSAYGYAYDPNGNRTEQHETNGGPEAVTTYEYDKSDRLTDVTYPDQVAHYTLDEVGNRRVESIDDAQGTPIARKTATFNDRDQLTRVSDSVSGVVLDYGYDLSGNQITKTQGPQTTELSYGPRDRLATLTLQGAPPSEVTHYAYDDAGLRIEKQTDGTLTRYQYDQGSLIGERNGLGNVLVRYSHGAERTLARSTGPVTLRYLHDGLKTPTTLLAADGGIAARDQYDAWGQVRNHSGASQPIGFTGYYHDDESGYYYAKARYYDATTARFTSEDPELGALMTPPSLHRYLYAYANPTVYVDPDGRWPWDWAGRKDFSREAGDNGAVDPHRTSQRQVMQLSGLRVAAAEITGGVAVAGAAAPELLETGAAMWTVGRAVATQVVRYGAINAALSNPVGTRILGFVGADIVACGMAGIPICPTSSLPSSSGNQASAGRVEEAVATATAEARAARAVVDGKLPVITAEAKSGETAFSVGATPAQLDAQIPHMPGALREVGGGDARYLVDSDTGLTVVAEGRITGPHPGRRKGSLPEPAGGLVAGEHRGHLIPEGGVDTPEMVNVTENLISEAPTSNLGPKKSLDYQASQIAAQNPESKVKLYAEPQREAGETRPYAVTYYVTQDGDVVRSMSILNPQKVEK